MARLSFRVATLVAWMMAAGNCYAVPITPVAQPVQYATPLQPSLPVPEGLRAATPAMPPYVPVGNPSNSPPVATAYYQPAPAQYAGPPVTGSPVAPDVVGNPVMQVSMQPSRQPALDPNQPGNIDRRLEAYEKRIAGLEGEKNKFPIVKLSGFAQLDQGLFTQSQRDIERLGNIQNGVGFRRTRLQALGKLSEFTNFTIEMDFATVGRPSFVDVWGEQQNLPFFNTIRIGQFRQPITMDGWTSIRHLEFLERSAPFQALDPFRRPGMMSYGISESERTTWAYSMFATGFTFYNGASTVYNELGGDTRFGTQIGDKGGVGFASRVTHLLYYDEPSEGRYLLHVGGGYVFAENGGTGTNGTAARTYEARSIPEFFVGDPSGVGLTAAGTPFVVDTGRFLANSYNLYHAEFAGNAGQAHFQSEVLIASVNQVNGPAVYYPSAYFQCGYFLTGESVNYNKQAGVLDYNVVPFSDFFGLGRGKRMGGWGAWETAFRWSYLDLSATNINPGNRLPPLATLPPVPNAGVLNESTVALNWWWNRNTRVQFNWIHNMTKYNDFGSAALDIFAARFQVEF